MPPLIDRRRHRVVAVIIPLGAVVTIVLGVIGYHAHSTGFDSWAFRVTDAHLGPSASGALLDLSDPAISITLMAAVVVVAAYVRHWTLAVLAVVGPVLAVLVTEFVLKPLVDRTLYGVVGSYPSGHEANVASAALVLLVVSAQARLRSVVRSVVLLLLAVWVVLAAVGMVRYRYHYATDTVGAIGLSTVIVLGTALVIDRAAHRAR